MKMVKSYAAWLGALLVWLSPLGAERARAYGGLWSAPDAKIEQSAAQVLFVDHPDATITAVVRIRYAGAGKKLAWLLPVPGTPTVTISSKKFDEPVDLTFPQPRGREQVKVSKKVSKQLGKSKLTLEELEELKKGAKVSLQYYPMLGQVMELVIEEPGS